MFELPKLNYNYDALEPFIDQKTMEIHHSKHHQAYINKLNDAIIEASKLSAKLPAKLPIKFHPKNREISEMKNMDIHSLVKKIDGKNPAIRNNGGGHYNHSFFWKILKKNSSNISPELKDAINQKFGSLETMKKEFEQAATTRFGSGWAWLILSENSELVICSTPNQDNPLMPISEKKGEPLLGLDVWEHAYYLKYQNRRPEYINAFWNVVDWQAVSNHYDRAKK